MTTPLCSVVELGDHALRCCPHEALYLSRDGIVIRTSGLLGLAASDLYEVAVMPNLTFDPTFAPLSPPLR